MKWINASKQLPEKGDLYHTKIVMKGTGLESFPSTNNFYSGEWEVEEDYEVVEWLDDYSDYDFQKEWELSEKAHDTTIEQLRRTQEARNEWHEMADRLAEEMRKAEWDSPLYWEYKKLWAYYHTGNG